jgi:hypothetical protein
MSRDIQHAKLKPIFPNKVSAGVAVQLDEVATRGVKDPLREEKRREEKRREEKRRINV